MLFGQSDNNKLIVGYDLSEEYVQISFLRLEDDAPETISTVAGEEAFNIPSVLAKREGVNQWYFGKEAIKYAEETGRPLIRNLLTLAKLGEPVDMDEQQYDPVALLALFFKRSLSMLSTVSGAAKIGALMITVDMLEESDSKLLEKMISMAKPKADTIVCQSHIESFYYYMIGQQAELLEGKTVLFQRGEGKLSAIYLECNQYTTPKVVHAVTKEVTFPQFNEGQEEEADRELAYFIDRITEDNRPGAAYLIGEEFRENQIPITLEMLCKKCRVFQGNNLYSKGACIGMRENYYLPSKEGKQFFFLGREKLKANVGMNLLKQGEESYLALLDAGTNWYDAKKTVELYLKEQRKVEIMATSLIGGETTEREVYLEGLPEGITRIRLHIYMTDPGTVVMEVTDLGFGQIRPATELSWSMTLEV